MAGAIAGALSSDRDLVGGFQCLKAVQTLQGLPSGPKTIPGGVFGASPGIQTKQKFSEPSALRLSQSKETPRVQSHISFSNHNHHFNTNTNLSFMLIRSPSEIVRLIMLLRFI